MLGGPHIEQYREYRKGVEDHSNTVYYVWTVPMHYFFSMDFQASVCASSICGYKYATPLSAIQGF
jgi:hypothetical protein